MRKITIVAGVGLLMFGLAAWAQQETGVPGQTGTQRPAMTDGPAWHKATDLVGKQVNDAQSNKLGDIKDLIIDMRGGGVLFAVIPGKYVDKRDQDIAVPFSALRLAGDAKYLTLNTTKDQLAGAPAFNEKNWPNMTDTGFIEKVYAYFHAPLPMSMERTREAGHIEREPGQRTPGQQP